MIRSIFFLLRLLVAWALLYLTPLMMVSEIARAEPAPIFGVLFVLLMIVVAIAGFSHIRRVRLVAGALNGSTLASAGFAFTTAPTRSRM